MFFDYMQIDSPTVKGSWNPKKVNIMLYKNGIGKSTFLEAVRFLLTGESDRDAISVTAKADLVSVSRTKEPGKTPVCTLGGKKVSGTALTDFMTSRMNSESNVVKMQMIPEISLADPKTLMTCIMARIPEDLSADRLIDYAKQAGLPDECVPMLLEYTKKLAPQDGFGLGKLDEIAETIRADRLGLTGKNSDISAMIRQTAATEPSMTPEKIEELIRKASDAESEKAYTERLREWERLSKEQERLAAEIAQIEKDIAAAGTPAVMADDERADVSQKIGKDAAQILEMQKKAAVYDANIAIFRKTLAAISENICPISKRIVCTVDKSGLRNDIETALRQNETMAEAAQKSLSDTAEDKRKKEEQLKADDEARKQQEKLSRLTWTLSAKKSLVKALPERPERKLSASGLDIDKLKKDLENAVAWERKQKLIAENESLVKDIERMRTIENVLRKDAKSVVIGAYIDVLSDCVNEAIGMFPGYAAKLVTEKGSIRMAVKVPREQAYRPTDTLSTGERLIADMALSVMLNEISKTGLLFIDNVECLDKENLKTLKTILEKKKFTDAFDHIFVCGVDHAEVSDILGSIRDVNRM